MLSAVEIDQLRVEGLRVLRGVEMDFGGRCVLITGGNGAGKTTLLEAVYLLGRGRSFRGRRAGDLTTLGVDKTRVEGRLVCKGESVDLVYERSKRGTGRWADGVAVAEVADGGKMLSVRLIGENAQQLFEGERWLRRRFLDWNLFHVEPGYGGAWRRFGRVLDQRNAWLRRGARGRSIWDEEYVAAGEELEELRVIGVKRIDLAFRARATDIPGLSGLGIWYKKGMPEGGTLGDALAGDRDGERAVGYTRVGPHRADLVVVRDGRSVPLSRGQQKAAICVLQLACAAVQEGAQGSCSLWLLDDLWADLDGDSVKSVAGMLLGGRGQCLFTSIGRGEAGVRTVLPVETRVFHVEQGKVAAST